jgi:hypothetical protein
MDLAKSMKVFDGNRSAETTEDWEMWVKEETKKRY